MWTLILIFFCSCTDGILFVVDSVDMERMEEAKMELMRTAKCPENLVRIISYAMVNDVCRLCLIFVYLGCSSFGPGQ